MMNPMNPSVVRLAVAQLNLTVGDLEGNCNKIAQYACQAAQQGARVLLTPELSVTGYPPEDLLLRPSFLEQTSIAVGQLCLALKDVDVYVLIGHPVLQEGVLFNAASVLYQGRVLGTYFKRDLPNTEVFDEQRYFASGQKPFVFEVDGVCFGVNICEDTWAAEAPSLAKAAGAEVLLVLNASPFHRAKGALREQVLMQRVQETGLPLVYANMVGGQDELVFDGGSLALNAQAQVVLRMACFEEELGLLDLARVGLSGVALKVVSASVEVLDEVAQVYKALTLGVRDYVHKNRFPGAIIGLSGGVDSALTLAIAVDALGADRVRAVMMPSPYTADISLLDSRDMVRRLGVQYDEIAIEPCMQAFSSGLAPLFQGFEEDTTEENLQARIRGTMLMALSNKTGRIVLTTGNKSEMATGYCTLYGDMAGGFAVIKDVFKTLVYRLCVYRNLLSEVIPERIITRPPSAELRLEQVDQDSLPPYDVLDEILARYMEDNQSSAQIVDAGFGVEDVQKAVRLLRINEYKRRQAPIGVRVTHRAFGRDWRYPITSRFDDLKGL